MVAVVTTDLIAEHVDFVGLIAEAAEERPPQLRHLIVLGESSPAGFLDRAPSTPPGEACPSREVHRARRRVRIRDEAMMMYTSGTTRARRAACSRHEALVRSGVAAASAGSSRTTTRFWNPLPMFHMGRSFPLLAHMHVGALTIVTQHALRRRRGAADDRGGA